MCPVDAGQSHVSLTPTNSGLPTTVMAFRSVVSCSKSEGASPQKALSTTNLKILLICTWLL